MIRDTSAQDQTIQHSPQRRRMIWVGTAVALVVAMALVLPWATRILSAGQSVSVSRLAFATVERGPFTRDIAAEGRVVAAVRPTLYARSPGMVTLKVHAGDTVHKGQELARIESFELVNQLARERAELKGLQVAWELSKVEARTQRQKLQMAFDTARIDAASAERDLGRYRTAYAKGAYSRAQVEKVEDRLKKAQIALDHAKEDLALSNDSLDFGIKAKNLAAERQKLLVQNLQRQVENLKIRSPVDGQVGQVFVAPRSTVAENAKILTVIDLSALQVEVQVPESFARDLGVGMAAKIAGNGKAWTGAVSAISPEVVNGQVATRVRFEGDKPEELRQNQRLSVRILLDHRDSALTVARGSFVDESGGRYAYVMRDGLAVKTPVQLGATSIDKVEILKGLEPGDRVVISGVDNFKGADRVVISH